MTRADARHKRIPLRGRDGAVRAYTLVDAADFAWLNRWRWYCEKGYVVRKESVPYRKGEKRRWRKIYMHRLILELPEGDDPRQGEHENRNPLDNRRGNLRVATHGENMQNVGRRSDNRSGFRGVSWNADRGKWRARVSVNGKTRTIGHADTAQAAARLAIAARAEHMPFEAHHA